MVVRNRIAHLKKLVENGAKMVGTVAANPDTSIEKVRIHIYPSVRILPEHQTCMMHLLDMVMHASDAFHVADRGHTCSDSHSEVTFIISKGKFGRNVRRNRLCMNLLLLPPILTGLCR